MAAPADESSEPKAQSPRPGSRSTRDQALELAVALESSWARTGNDMSYSRAVRGAKEFEAYLTGEANTDGR